VLCVGDGDGDVVLCCVVFFVMVMLCSVVLHRGDDRGRGEGGWIYKVEEGRCEGAVKAKEGR